MVQDSSLPWFESPISKTEYKKKWQEESHKKDPDRRRRLALKSRYGMTLEDYQDRFDEQSGMCGVCEEHQDNLTRRLVVDHDHNTGKIRGLLCHKCNAALGNLQESVHVVEAALNYIMKHEPSGRIDVPKET